MKYLSNNFNGESGTPKTSFEVKREGDSLFFSFVAHDSYLYSYSEKNNDDLWKGCVVEVFLDLGDDDFYYEFEVAPNGTTFVAKKYKDHLEYLPGDLIDTKVAIKGDSYIVEIRIDLSKFPKYRHIRYNAFRIERGKILEALSPTYCDTFHVRDKFISLKM